MVFAGAWCVLMHLRPVFWAGVVVAMLCLPCPPAKYCGPPCMVQVLVLYLSAELLCVVVTTTYKSVGRATVSSYVDLVC